MEYKRDGKIFWISAGILYSLALALIFSQIGYVHGKNVERTAYEAQQSKAVVLSDRDTTLEAATPTSALTEEARFLVTRYNDKIAVYENGELMRIVEVEFDSLRKEDRDLLQEGIPAHTQEELAQVLEDFIS
jgi:hypothetical protein